MNLHWVVVVAIAIKAAGRSSSQAFPLGNSVAPSASLTRRDSCRRCRCGWRRNRNTRSTSSVRSFFIRNTRIGLAWAATLKIKSYHIVFYHIIFYHIMTEGNQHRTRPIGASAMRNGMEVNGKNTPDLILHSCTLNIGFYLI